MDRVTPTRHPLARIGVWGHPWHGLVTGGQLALPNGQQMTYRQPGGTFHWERTAAHLVEVPGITPVSRTPAEQLADAAAGRQWLSSALISGGDSQLYGVPLGAGRWVWIDEAGDRWLVDATALHNKTWSAAGVPATVSISVRRFGVFSSAGAAAPVLFSVPVPDLGQSSPTVYSSSGTVATTFTVSLFSIHPQGRRAVFMLHYAVPPAWPSGRHPCGWIEVQLSGSGAAPAAEIVVVADRLTTLGGAEVISSTVTPGNNVRVWYRESVTTDTLNLNYPTCSGYRDTLREFALSSADLGASGFSQRWTYQFGNTIALAIGYAAAESVSWSGMVLAVWYDPSGSRRTLTLDMSWVYEADQSGSGDGQTGAAIGRQTAAAGAGACTLVPTAVAQYSMSVSREVSETESITYSYKLDGVVLDTVSIERTCAGTESLEVWSEDNGLGNVNRDHWRITSELTHTFSGGGWGGAPIVQSQEWSDEGGYAGAPGAYGHMLKPSDQTAGRRALNLGALSWDTVWMDPGEVRGVTPVRLGHAALGWVSQAGDEAEDVTTWSLTDKVVTPGGAITAPMWSVSQAGVAWGAMPSSMLYVALSADGDAVAATSGPICRV